MAIVFSNGEIITPFHTASYIVVIITFNSHSHAHTPTHACIHALTHAHMCMHLQAHACMYIYTHALTHASTKTYAESRISSMCRVNMEELQKAMYSASSSLVREDCLDLYQACFFSSLSVSSSNLPRTILAMFTSLVRMSLRHACTPRVCVWGGGGGGGGESGRMHT